VLEVQKVKFSGGLSFDENGTLYRNFDPNAVQYVGEPNKAIDHAWAELLRGASRSNDVSRKEEMLISY
jgi:hypothetical protein